MKSASSNKLRVVYCAAALIVGMSASAALAEGGPIKVAVGNGTIIGSSSSKLGVGILTPQVNGTPNSVRILGTEKTAGVYSSDIKGPNGAPTQAQVMTPIDGVLNRHLPH